MSKLMHETVLDELDKKILHCWDQNARMSASQIAKKIKSKKETVHFRMKRLEKNGIVTSTMTEIQVNNLGYHNIKIYLKFQNFTKEIQEQYYLFLKTIPSVSWITTSSGSWESQIVILSKSIYQFYEDYAKIQNKFSEYLLDKEIIINQNWFYYNRKWLRPEAAIITQKYGGEPTEYKLSDIDKEILKQFTKNAKTKIIDIANKLGESAQTIINHKKNLEKKEIITKYSLNLDHKKLGMRFCKAFIKLNKIDKKRINEFYNTCEAQENIFAVATTMGSWDLEIEFEIDNYEKMIQIINQIRTEYQDIIKSYETAIITEQIPIKYPWE